MRWSATRSGERFGDLSTGLNPGWVRHWDLGTVNIPTTPSRCAIRTYGQMNQYEK
jgi:hypothetical protein